MYTKSKVQQCKLGTFSRPSDIVLYILNYNFQRFDGDMEICREGEVCADVFNFTRDHGDGTGRLESRFIQNCKCPPGTLPCGQTGTQLMFRETKTQS